jgi:dTDP-glucose 4,6-dehydratase
MPHLSRKSSLSFLKGDVRTFAFPEQEFDFVVHAAVPTTAGAAGRPIELLSTLVDGTEQMIGLARACGTKRFLFVSSGAGYGRQPPHLAHIPEDYIGGPDWLNPNSAYGEGKRVSEQLCALHALESGIEFTIARCFAFVGPHLPLDQHFAIGNFIRDALAGRNIAVHGDGTPRRSYLYAADLSIWLWTLLFQEAGLPSNPKVFNVGSGEAVSIRDLAEMVVEELNPSLTVEIAREPIAGMSPSQYVPDVRRAEMQLGLRPTVELREAIRRTAAWLR